MVIDAAIYGFLASAAFQFYLKYDRNKIEKFNKWNTAYHCNECDAIFTQAIKAQLFIEGGIKEVQDVYDDSCPICGESCTIVHDANKEVTLTIKEIRGLEKQMKIQNKLFYSNLFLEFKNRVFEARLQEEKLQLEHHKELIGAGELEDLEFEKSITTSEQVLEEYAIIKADLFDKLNITSAIETQEMHPIEFTVECEAINNYFVAISNRDIVYIAKQGVSLEDREFTPLSDLKDFPISSKDLIDILIEFGKRFPQYRKFISEQLKVNNNVISLPSKTQFSKILRFDDYWYTSDNFNFQVGCSEKGEPSFRNMKTETIYLISSLLRTPIGSAGHREVLKACAEYPNEKLRKKILTAAFTSLKEALELSIVFGFTDQNNYILAFDENKRSVYISLKTGVVKLLSNIMGDKEVSSEDIREIVDFISKVPHNLHKKILQMDIKGVKIPSSKKDYISKRTKYIWDTKAAAYYEYHKYK